MDAREIKIQQLISIFLSQRPLKIPLGLRLFIIGKDNYVRVYKGRIERGTHAPGFRIGHELTFDRGRILDFFAKLEFVVTELYYLKMTPNDFAKGYMLDKLLERVNFLQRIRILKDVEVISPTIYSSIEKINRVRNDFAHVWGENEVLYNNVSLKASFAEFKADAEKVWKQLEELYIKEQEKIDIDGIIKQIEELNSTS